jgi:hypothetical protein
MDNSFFTYLHPSTQVSAFKDLLTQHKFDLLSDLFDGLNLDFDNDTKIIDLSEPYLKQDNFPIELKEKILNFNFNHLKKYILDTTSEGYAVEGSKIRVLGDMIHETLSLHSLFKDPDDKLNWIDIVLNEMKRDTFIDFTEQSESLILTRFYELDSDIQLKLISQSNIWQYLDFNENYYQSKIKFNDTYYLSIDSCDNEYAKSYYPKVGVILNALAYVKHSHFQEFLNQFSLTTEEQKEMQRILLDVSLPTFNYDNMVIFLSHYDLKLSDLINNQIQYHYKKHTDYEDKTFDFEFTFSKFEDMIKFKDILKKEKKKIINFTNTEFLLDNFNAMNRFFTLYNSDETIRLKAESELIEFLKLTSLYKKDMKDIELIQNYFHKITQKPKGNLLDNYQIESLYFHTFIKRLEQDICILEKKELDSCIDNNTSVQITTKKMKI